MTQNSTLNLKSSLPTMNGIYSGGSPVVSQGRPGRPCANCTCSPGLLSRQNRKSSMLLRQLGGSRKRPSMRSTGSSRDSIYSSDTICQSKYVNTSERLLHLRRKMVENDLCCYIVPSEDEHQSEYVSLADQRRSFISGFTGSAGVACISRDLLNFNDNDPEGQSILSTDGRYFNQASQELDFNWSLLRQGEDTLTWPEWCVRLAIDMSEALGGKEAKIGIDPKVISYDQVVKIQKLIRDKTQDTKATVSLVPVQKNLVDEIWGYFEPVPVRDSNDLLLVNSNYTNETFQDKKQRVLNYLHEKTPNCKTFCVATLDEICWLLNLRGSDIQYNPVFYSYLLLRGDETILFTDDPYDDKIKEYFETNLIKVEPYGQIWSHLSSLATAYSKTRDPIAISSGSSWEIVRTLGDTHYRQIQSPLELFKAVKNDVEISNAHAAQVKDAVCLVQFFAWLENQLIAKEALIDEYRAATKLLEIRKTQRNFMGNSFETISSTGANAAIIHYAPPEENSAMIDPSRIYLCDSGSQFIEGTTDITRTLHFTTPSAEEIEKYTLVLKGNLALERLTFPEGTSGFNIDVIARQFLWQQGLDYRHGTGHGVGSFLNVHEGPIGIGFRPNLQSFPLESGNIITNEPGFYKDGEYGIRIENDMLVEKAEGLKFGERQFLKFKNLTLVPYCRKLINEKMLTPEEKAQINAYHNLIWHSIVPFTQPQSITYRWLKRETAQL
ncbi:aminopeptidase P LALA0_S01e13498g [Lachancea lanzarotensis]|uniref:Xaa-Pro aminopeptidase n=1 Tax=Lachancea lanzarotensis TaxID=1245769 RepID=A0A0C7ML89_9SACH|nr:uncharacterized protein LALA0_S01e13498g [Lachancea lanzarotensis]CEP60550.1 LALA0S01e13498g1_1 [Lachancea lanzarotensis]